MVDGCSIAALNSYLLCRQSCIIHVVVCFHTVLDGGHEPVFSDMHLNLTGNLGNISLACRADLLLIVCWQCLDSCCLFVMHM
jgi:hypothetical protein